MATTDLGKWMITNGGEYNPDTTYEQLTMVLYENSTYITLRTVTGITPNNDKINYILMAQGFSANALADVVAKDTYGAIGNVGESVSAQSLIDYLTNEVVNNLIKKTSISTVQVNSDDMVPSSSLAYSMQRAINDLNSNLKNKVDINDIQKGSTAGISCAANAITESTITFPRAFNSAPKVVVSFYSDTKLAKYGMMTPMVCNVTTTNFKVRIANASDTALTPAIYWIARE